LCQKELATFGTRSNLKTFDLVTKVVGTDFGTRSKVLIMVFLALKTFDLVTKVVGTDFGT
jgi:hypothetical protein